MARQRAAGVKPAGLTRWSLRAHRVAVGKSPKAKQPLLPPVPRPVLLKLGGSLLTDKAAECTFRRNVARRLVSEVAKAKVSTVLLHGAGSFGHPQVARHRIGEAKAKAVGVSEVLAAVGSLHAEMVELAAVSALNPLSFPLHGVARRDGDDLVDLPVAAIKQALDEGHTPVISGTLVRDRNLGWSVLSADEILANLAAELTPRLAVFATDVDGVFDRDPKDDATARLFERIKPGQGIEAGTGGDGDVTGRMQGKLERAYAVAQHAPTVILNGSVRNRLLDALKGKPVPGTRVQV